MNELKSMVERYCPALERNVPIEVAYLNTGNRKESCLLHHLCEERQASCSRPCPVNLRI